MACSIPLHCLWERNHKRVLQVCITQQNFQTTTNHLYNGSWSSATPTPPHLIKSSLGGSFLVNLLTATEAELLNSCCTSHLPSECPCWTYSFALQNWGRRSHVIAVASLPPIWGMKRSHSAGKRLVSHKSSCSVSVTLKGFASKHKGSPAASPQVQQFCIL